MTARRPLDTAGEDGGLSARRAERLVDLMEPPLPAPCETRGGGDGAESCPDTVAPRILSVTPEGEGETVSILLVLPDLPEGEPRPDGGGGLPAGRVKLCLLVEQYAELAAEGIRLAAGEITREQACCLLAAGELCAAIRRGMGLLQYGDCSARALVSKLVARGVPRSAAAGAADYLARRGYIREEETARLRAVRGLRKGWGPRRIRDDLRAHGFDADATDQAMAGLEDVDFSAHCAAVIRKRYGEVPTDPVERKKMVAVLLRLGYDTGHIREASRGLGE